MPLTVSHGNSADSWNMSPVRPCTSDVSRDGRSSPAKMLSNVLLPQPDAPSRQTNSPFADGERHLVERVHGIGRVAIHLAHVGEHDRGLTRHRGDT